MTTDVYTLPSDLPVPTDDGAADHLRGAVVPSLVLASTSGGSVDLARLAASPAVLFFYPRTGGRGKSSGAEWDLIPGARGCTPQSCGFRDLHAEGRPIFGTCAGLILLARDVDNPRQFSLDFIDVGVERNAYGRQRESFEARGSASLEGRPTPVEMVFIRAPRIRRVGAGVETLAHHADEPVLARQGSVLVATFHPELTDDPTIHEYFCAMVAQAAARRGAAA